MSRNLIKILTPLVILSLLLAACGASWDICGGAR